MQTIIGLFILIIHSTCYAFINVNNTPIAGGIAVIDLDTKYKNPQVFFGDKKIYLQKINNHYQALVGIPLLTKSGTNVITILENSTKTIQFFTKVHKYESQYITLTGKNKKYVTPNKQHLKRIIKERVILKKARNTFTNKTIANNNFTIPVKGILTSPFGLRRFYNNKPRRPHTGLDYYANIGTKVIAPVDGVVILTGEFFFNGKTVFLDHGMGLISAFIHLKDINVNIGDYIKQGNKLGSVGQTGRATGPHLHWSVYLNTTAINPNLLF